MKLWCSPTSPYARKVRIVLREKAIACSELLPSAARVEIGSKNPLGKVPTLELDDGRVLYDSTVIVEYLEGLQPEPALIPSSFYDRIEARRWEALADGIADAVVTAMLESKRSVLQRDSSVIEKHHA